MVRVRMKHVTGTRTYGTFMVHVAGICSYCTRTHDTCTWYIYSMIPCSTCTYGTCPMANVVWHMCIWYMSCGTREYGT